MSNHEPPGGEVSPGEPTADGNTAGESDDRTSAVEQSPGRDGDADQSETTEPQTTQPSGQVSRASTATEDATGSETVSGEAKILDVRGLDAGYGDLQILSDVDVFVDRGEYVTIVGPNGAGKSTVMKSIFGLTNVMGGEIVFDDLDITGDKPEDVIHYGLGYVPQSKNIFSGLSVRENLEMGAYILDEVPQDRLADIYDRFPILKERQSQKAGTLSGGQQQMLAMGRALMLDPELLMLDEPSAGLAPDLVKDMFDRIDGINDAGTAILMVEQNAKEALRRCDRGYVLVQGENRFVDTGEALLADQEVRQQFLGG